MLHAHKQAVFVWVFNARRPHSTLCPDARLQAEGRPGRELYLPICGLDYYPRKFLECKTSVDIFAFTKNRTDIVKM